MKTSEKTSEKTSGNTPNSLEIHLASEREKLRNFFVRITANSELHAKFVNTLSFLEYIGARKIIKSQHETRMTADLLSHIAEEIRHAQLFKRMALALSNGQLDDYGPASLWEGEKAWGYFQGLDQTCARFLQKLLEGLGQPGSQPDPWTCYLLTTLGIEKRALLAYEVYLEFAGAQPGLESHRKLLSGILKEEEAHLRETEEALRKTLPRPELYSTVIEELARLEGDLFWSWIQ